MDHWACYRYQHEVSVMSSLVKSWLTDLWNCFWMIVYLYRISCGSSLLFNKICSVLDAKSFYLSHQQHLNQLEAAVRYLTYMIRPHALIINFFLLFSTRTLARRSTYIRLSKIFVQGPNSHVHNYFGNPQLHSAWSVSPQRRPTSFVQMPDYLCRGCFSYTWLACPGVEAKLPFWAYRQWFESEIDRSFHWGP